MGENANPVLILLPLLLLMSAFFSGSETALFSLNFLKIRHLQARAGRRGNLVAKMMVRPKQLIITILIGNDLVNIAASSIVGAYLIDLFGPEGRWYAIGIMTWLILIFGEIIPKTLAVTYPVGFSLAFAPVIYRLYRLASVPYWLVQRFIGKIMRFLGGGAQPNLITEDEFKSLVREGRKIGILDRGEEGIIYNILELGDITASSVMVPRTELFAVEEETKVEDVLKSRRGKAYSRIPVYRKDIDNITGILYVKDMLMARARKELDPMDPVGEMARKPFIVPENMRTDELFIELRNRRVHMAVVVDEYGGTSGIVTMEDLLRQLFEDVSVEASPEKGFYQKISPGFYAVSGKMSIEEFNHLFTAAISDANYKTIGGTLLHLFGRLPRRGEELRWGSLHFQITAVEGHRIVGLRVKKLGAGEQK